ncbi:hypothetical protein HanIR_Chr08g0381971 [Helianthus annuus]|nr:hypothetical protein HanIR_Chr08g0381971 [Helianthus annuus]
MHTFKQFCNVNNSGIIYYIILRLYKILINLVSTRLNRFEDQFGFHTFKNRFEVIDRAV